MYKVNNFNLSFVPGIERDQYAVTDEINKFYHIYY